jgi:peptide/nickel transport system ATP-binding protein
MLDAISQARIWRVLLETVKERGLGMLVISHNPQLLDGVCDSTIAMHDLASS